MISTERENKMVANEEYADIFYYVWNNDVAFNIRLCDTCDKEYCSECYTRQKIDAGIRLAHRLVPEYKVVGASYGRRTWKAHKE